MSSRQQFLLHDFLNNLEDVRPKVEIAVQPIIGWVDNLHDITNANKNFRAVQWTGEHSQLVVMCIQPGEDIGKEIHEKYDQIIYFQDGPAKVILSKTENGPTEEHKVTTGWTLIIPAGNWHNIINIGSTPLKLYTVYAPANHKPGTVHKTKADALLDPNEQLRKMMSLSRQQVLTRNFLENLESAGNKDVHPVEAPPDPKSPEDSLRSIAHLADTITHNLAHARSHLLEAMRNINDEDLVAAAWNGDHSQKHMLDAEEHAAKLVKHIADHPTLKSEFKELTTNNQLHQAGVTGLTVDQP